MHALYCVCRRARNSRSGSDRAGNGYHVDVFVARNSVPDSGSITDHKIKNAIGHACFVKNLSEKNCRKRRQFARLQHHGTPGRQGRRDLANNLGDGPIPRRNQPGHTYRFPHDKRFIFRYLEIVSLQYSDNFLKVRDCEACLST